MISDWWWLWCSKAQEVRQKEMRGSAGERDTTVQLHLNCGIAANRARKKQTHAAVRWVPKSQHYSAGPDSGTDSIQLFEVKVPNCESEVCWSSPHWCRKSNSFSSFKPPTNANRIIRPQDVASVAVPMNGTRKHSQKTGTNTETTTQKGKCNCILYWKLLMLVLMDGSRKNNDYQCSLAQIIRKS